MARWVARLDVCISPQGCLLREAALGFCEAVPGEPSEVLVMSAAMGMGDGWWIMGMDGVDWDNKVPCA